MLLPHSCHSAAGTQNKIEHGKHVGREWRLQLRADRALHRQLLHGGGGGVRCLPADANTVTDKEEMV